MNIKTLQEKVSELEALIKSARGAQSVIDSMVTDHQYGLDLYPIKREIEDLNLISHKIGVVKRVLDAFRSNNETVAVTLNVSSSQEYDDEGGYFTRFSAEAHFEFKDGEEDYFSGDECDLTMFVELEAGVGDEWDGTHAVFERAALEPLMQDDAEISPGIGQRYLDAFHAACEKAAQKKEAQKNAQKTPA
jgi:hypothetical protein